MSAPKTWITSNPRPNNRSTPTAKRSPSILVTDVRSFPSKSPAPFAGGRSKSGPQALHSSKVPGRSPRKFHKVTVNHILSNISEIPSAQNRYPQYPDQTGQIQGQPLSSNSTNHYDAALGSSYGRTSLGNSTIARSTAMSNGSSANGLKASKSSMGNRMSIARLSQNIPTRTSKVSEKFVLIPDDIDPGFQFDDYDDDFDAVPPTENDLLFLTESDGTRRSYAERLPKERRESKLPRVTAYYTGDGFRLQETSNFLRLNHRISPRIYDEALYAPYYLPLFPGENGCRIRSAHSAKGSEGQSLMETLIDRSEQSDYHFEYYSSMERDIDRMAPPVQSVENSNNNLEFDPSEPQYFSPPRHMSPRLDIREDDNLEDENDTGDSDSSIPGIADNESNSEENSETNSINENNDTAPASNDDDDNNNNNNNNDSPSNNEFNGYNSYDPISGDSLSGTDTEEAESIKSIETPDLTKHAEIFIFAYGVIVFWNFTESQEKDILADLTFARVPIPSKKVSSTSTGNDEDDDDDDDDDNNIRTERGLIIRPIQDQDIETEEFHFGYSPKTVRPRIYNDMITLRTGNHMVKLAMSHAIAQSTKLCRFETRMDSTMNDVILVPRALALTGKLGMKREQVVRMSGKLFKIRVDVNLSSNVLDTPEIFWEDEPSLNPLYAAVREYLEIDQRILVLNERCKVFLELTDIISDSIAESNMSRITWIIIVLIIISLLVSSVEIYFRFSLLSKPREICL